jgi:hypothetical protein
MKEISTVKTQGEKAYSKETAKVKGKKKHTDNSRRVLSRVPVVVPLPFCPIPSCPSLLIWGQSPFEPPFVVRVLLTDEVADGRHRFHSHT